MSATVKRRRDCFAILRKMAVVRLICLSSVGWVGVQGLSLLASVETRASVRDDSAYRDNRDPSPQNMEPFLEPGRFEPSAETIARDDDELDHEETDSAVVPREETAEEASSDADDEKTAEEETAEEADEDNESENGPGRAIGVPVRMASSLSRGGSEEVVNTSINVIAGAGAPPADDPPRRGLDVSLSAGTVGGSAGTTQPLSSVIRELRASSRKGTKSLLAGAGRREERAPPEEGAGGTPTWRRRRANLAQVTALTSGLTQMAKAHRQQRNRRGGASSSAARIGQKMTTSPEKKATREKAVEVGSFPSGISASAEQKAVEERRGQEEDPLVEREQEEESLQKQRYVSLLQRLTPAQRSTSFFEEEDLVGVIPEEKTQGPDDDDDDDDALDDEEPKRISLTSLFHGTKKSAPAASAASETSASATLPGVVRAPQAPEKEVGSATLPNIRLTTTDTSKIPHTTSAGAASAAVSRSGSIAISPRLHPAIVVATAAGSVGSEAGSADSSSRSVKNASSTSLRINSSIRNGTAALVSAVSNRTNGTTVTTIINENATTVKNAVAKNSSTYEAARAGGLTSRPIVLPALGPESKKFSVVQSGATSGEAGSINRRAGREALHALEHIGAADIAYLSFRRNIFKRFPRPLVVVLSERWEVAVLTSRQVLTQISCLFRPLLSAPQI